MRQPAILRKSSKYYTCMCKYLLVVSTPPKNMTVSWEYYSQYVEDERKIKPPIIHTQTHTHTLVTSTNIIWYNDFWNLPRWDDLRGFLCETIWDINVGPPSLRVSHQSSPWNLNLYVGGISLVLRQEHICQQNTWYWVL